MLTQHPHTSGAAGSLRAFQADLSARALSGGPQPAAHIATYRAAQITGVGVSKQR